MPAVKNASQPAAAVAAVREEDLLEQIMKSWGEGKSREEEEVISQGLEDFLALLPEGSLDEVDPETLIANEIRATDDIIARQLNLVLHHDQFKKVESAWRGLHYMVAHVDAGPNLKISLANVSKATIEADAKRANGDFRQSQLYKRLVENELGAAGGKPFSLLLGAYEFNAGSADMQLLKRHLAPLAAEGHAPFIGGVSAQFFGCSNFAELPAMKNLKGMLADSVAFAEWRSLRATEESRYVGLVLPRMLARSPYQPSDDASGFQFREDVKSSDPESFLWTNAVFAYGARVGSALAAHNWPVAVCGKNAGGRCDDLPIFKFKSAAGRDLAVCPTEIQVTDAKERELAGEGFISLVHYKNEDYAVFYGMNAVHKPKRSTDAATQADLVLATRLPNIMASGRFAHHMAVMFRDMIGSAMDPKQVEQQLDQWLQGYCLATPETATDEQKAAYPLRSAKVVVESVPGTVGHYFAKVELTPHYRIEEMSVEMILRAARLQTS